MPCRNTQSNLRLPSPNGAVLAASANGRYGAIVLTNSASQIGKPGGQSGKSYIRRREDGFFARWLAGPMILDVGCGAAGPVLPWAIGIDKGYPGYDGVTLPFADDSIDAVYSSHMLEHVPD